MCGRARSVLWLSRGILAVAAIPPGTAESQYKVLAQGNQHTEQYEAKHESSLLYEGGTLSYDPTVYGGRFQDRYHIKTLQVGPSCTAGRHAWLTSCLMYLAYTR